MKNNEVNKNNKKIVIKNKNRFAISIIGILVLVILVVLLLSGKKIKIDENTDLSTLNAKKYSTDIQKKYNEEGSKEKFIEDHDLIQGGIALYIMNNSTNHPDSFKNITDDIKKELKKSKWDLLEVDIPSFWNGEFTINDEGILKFKFANKDIEPDWINDEELEGKIVLN